MDELIRKKDALEAFSLDNRMHLPRNSSRTGTYVKMVMDRIKDLPPMPNHGKWYVESNSCVVFDVCDQCMRSVRHVAPFYNFCPHCGADMRCEADD